MTSNAPGTQPGLNVFAVLSIIFVWFAGILGLIFGYVALSQIKKTGERGRGLALASVILGWIAVAVALIIIITLMVSGAIYVSNAG